MPIRDRMGQDVQCGCVARCSSGCGRDLRVVTFADSELEDVLSCLPTVVTAIPAQSQVQLPPSVDLPFSPRHSLCLLQHECEV